MRNIIYSNYDMGDMFEEAKQFLMEEYPEFCDVEVEDKDGNISYEPSDSRIWDEVYNEDEFIWDDLWTELKHYFDNKTVMAVGNLGTWRGSFEGSKIGSFEDVFDACVKDCDYIELADEDGHFHIKSSHHDGTNYLEIRIITDEGEQKYEDWKYDYDTDLQEHEINKELFKNYSELPNIMNEVYGC